MRFICGCCERFHDRKTFCIHLIHKWVFNHRWCRCVYMQALDDDMQGEIELDGDDDLFTSALDEFLQVL